MTAVHKLFAFWSLNSPTVIQVLQILDAFSQDPMLQKAQSSGLGSPSHLGSVSSQCLAEQPGLISSLTWNNHQYLSNTTLAFHLSTLFFCLLLRVSHQSLSQICEDSVSLPPQLPPCSDFSLDFVIADLPEPPPQKVTSHTLPLLPPPYVPQAFLQNQPPAAPPPHPHCVWAGSCPSYSRGFPMDRIMP